MKRGPACDPTARNSAQCARAITFTGRDARLRLVRLSFVIVIFRCFFATSVFFFCWNSAVFNFRAKRWFERAHPRRIVARRELSLPRRRRIRSAAAVFVPTSRVEFLVNSFRTIYFFPLARKVPARSGERRVFSPQISPALILSPSRTRDRSSRGFDRVRKNAAAGNSGDHGQHAVGVGRVQSVWYALHVGRFSHADNVSGKCDPVQYNS